MVYSAGEGEELAEALGDEEGLNDLLALALPLAEAEADAEAEDDADALFDSEAETDFEALALALFDAEAEGDWEPDGLWEALGESDGDSNASKGQYAANPDSLPTNSIALLSLISVPVLAVFQILTSSNFPLKNCEEALKLPISRPTLELKFDVANPDCCVPCCDPST